MERLSRMTGFPEEVITKLPRVVVYGNTRLLIEQHEGIVTYQQDMICFQSVLGIITIRGQGLEIMKYGWQDAMIKGNISLVQYPEKAGKQSGKC